MCIRKVCPNNSPFHSSPHLSSQEPGSPQWPLITLASSLLRNWCSMGPSTGVDAHQVIPEAVETVATPAQVHHRSRRRVSGFQVQLLPWLCWRFRRCLSKHVFSDLALASQVLIVRGESAFSCARSCSNPSRRGRHSANTSSSGLRLRMCSFATR